MCKSYFHQPLPKPGEAERGEKGRIGYLLRQANLAHRLKTEQAMAEFHITLPQYSILSFLDLYPGLSNADLARLTLLTPQTVHVIVKNLQRSGAISRIKHETHGRIQQILLTANGKNLLKKCTKKILIVQQELLAGLSSKEEKIIRQWLVKIAL